MRSERVMRVGSGDKYRVPCGGRASGGDSQVFGVHGDIIVNILPAVIGNRRLGVIIVL